MKKYLAFLPIALFLFLAPQTNASIAFVSSATSTVAAASTTFNIPAFTTFAGNLLVVTVRLSNNSATTTVSDSVGNTFVRATVSTTTTPGQGEVFYAANIGAGTDTITVNFGASVGGVGQVEQYSGVATSTPVDTTSTANNGTGTGTSCASGAITPNNPNELIFGMCVQQTANTFALTPGGGFTLRGFTTRTGSQDMVQGSATTTSSTFTIGNSDGYIAAVVAFKPQVAAATTTPVNAIFFAGD